MNTVEPTSGGGNSPAVIVGFRLYGTTAILLICSRWGWLGTSARLSQQSDSDR